MVNKNIQMKKKNNNEWINLFPTTLFENVFRNDGKSLDNEIERLEQKDKNLTTQLEQTDLDIGETSIGKPNRSLWLELQERGVNVDWFGAVGDGITDDTQAIEQAIASISKKGSLIFTAGKIYRITRSVLIDPSKVRSIQGNNSYIKVDGDFDGIVYKGNKNFLGTAPSVDTNRLKDDELFNVISGLQFTGVKELGKFVGVGLVLEDQHTPLIKDCNFYNLSVGAKIKGSFVRNIIFSDSSFWGNRFAGIEFEENGEAHQAVFSNCHISYSKYSIYIGTEHKLYNLHITNCDMEAQVMQNEDFKSFLKSDGVVNELLISNTTFQSHLLEDINPENLMFLNKVNVLVLTGCYFAHSNTHAVEIIRGEKISITGCLFENINGDALIIKEGENMSISNNSFYKIGGTCLFSDGYFVEFIISSNIAKDVGKFSNVTSSSGILNSSVTNNIIKCRKAPSLKFKSTGSVRNVTFTDNDVYWEEEGYNHRLEYAIELQGNQMTSVVFTGNKLNLRSIGATDGVNGMIVKGLGNVYGVIVKNNIVYQMKSGKKAFDTNSTVVDEIVVSDNLSVREV